MPTFQNQATLYSNNSISRSNVVTGQFTEALSLTKTAVMDDYIQGDDITYIVTLVNSASSAVTGITLTDDMGAYTFGEGEDATTLYPLEYVEGSVHYYVNGVLQTAPTVTGTQPLVITGINVPANGNAMIVYEADATVFADPTVDGSITNTVTAANDNISAEATEVIGTEDEPRLTISKALEPTALNELESLTYTFIIQNHGNTAATAADGVYIVDEFDPAINITSVLIDGDAFTAYTYEDAIFTTTVGAITVPAATFEQDPTTGAWITVPGVTTVTVTGTI
ncbi:MAG: hypothetical protein IKM61_10550 [Eubacteriaceae bacterium]|nr:hypothetical protein [Eubacteriaceae bacterium]